VSEGLPVFVNEPILELRRKEARERLEAGMRTLAPRLPIRVPLWIGDDRREGDALVSSDPGAPGRVVAVAPLATAADAARAVAQAVEAAPAWAATPAHERAAALTRAAEWIRIRRCELTALVVLECAKPWGEADGDVCEAIDFLEYYARGAIALDRGATLLQVPGERNAMRYAPRGVVAVISPWNFPLAIPCGMTAAGLATGNAVVLKPAEQAPGCGAMLVEALRAGGVPAGAIALIPGEGDIGAALVSDSRVHTIAFTGSAPVGLEILKAAAEVADDQRHLKHVVAEMGGKNCIIVDADADLDDAVPAIVRSAFAYAGQKCSAASRVLVHEAIADTLIERLAGATATLQIGQADRFATDVPPVIEAAAQARVERYAALGAQEGTVAAGRGELPADGWFCAPTIVTDLAPDSALLHDEIFGPLLAVEEVKNVEEACDRVDELRFALTGGLFARNPHTIERVIARSPVGNLYVNRHTTGAMVGRQPFGGNRLSGTGSKAGGPNYLLHFVEPRAVTENTVRHGLIV
jgi:RHH-type proline utilization regulon transcriptional repressor/proline dehydrogenase/delta 1-pyrroline-5-carboxylate dehydrogenase